MILLSGISELLTLNPAAKKNGRKPTLRDLGILKDAAMIISGDLIVWVGKKKDVPSRFKIKRQIDLKNKVVLPGFVECHTHTVFAGSRAEEFELRLNGATYQEISKAGGGILSTVKATRSASDLSLVKSAQAAVKEFVRQGVTTLEIKSGYGLNEKEELRLLKLIRKLKGPQILSTYLGPHSRSPEHPSLDSYVKEMLSSTLPQIAKGKLADRVDMFVDDGFFTTDQAADYLALARKLNLSVALHAHQLSRTGAVGLAIHHGAHSAEHLIQLNAKDIRQLGSSKVACVLLPTADLYTNLNYPPARALIDAGATVALATDYNPGTAPSQELSLVGLLARLKMQMTLPEVICAYTVGGSHALRRLNEIGSLEIGKRADFVVLEGHWSELFYSVGRNEIAQTWVAGKNLKFS